MSLSTVLLVMAQTITKQTGIRVIVGGDKACTDGRIIRLPALGNVAKEYVQAIWGFLYHEVAHIIWTNFSLIMQGFKGTLQNAIEDVFIERRMMAFKAAAKAAILDMDRYLIAEGKFPPIHMIEDPANFLMLAIIYHGGVEDGVHCLEPLVEEIDQVGRIWFRDEFFLAFQGEILGKLKCLESSEDVADLTNKLWEMLESEIENLVISGEGDSQYAENIREIIISPLEIHIKSDSFAEAMARAGDPSDRRCAVAAPQGAFQSGNRPAATYQAAAAHATRIGETLKSIEDSGSVDINVTTERGNLDRRKLASAVAGNSNVFYRVVKTPVAGSTAIYILLDNSWSMSRRLETAKQAVLSVAGGLDRLRHTTYAVARFPITGKHHGIEYVDDVQVLTDFSETADSSWENYRFKEHGSTPMTEAIAFARQQLALSRADRKVIIMVTDGGADNTDSCAAEIDDCVNDGIELIGIGIESEEVAQVIDESVSIKDVSELAGALQQVIKPLIAAAA